MLHVVAWIETAIRGICGVGALGFGMESSASSSEVKQYHRPDCNAFDVFGRVLSGTVFRGDRVKILGSLEARQVFSNL